jgi:hypothetical protein
MAELLIPLIALGGLYMSKNDETDKKEEFVNMGNSKKLKTEYQDINYPTTKFSNNNIRKYDNPNQSTDKYYSEESYLNTHKTNPEYSVGGSKKQIVSLTGEMIDPNNFKHNNMQPFFGSKIKGNTYDSYKNSGSILDNMQGSGSYNIKKKETAPLFKPEKDLSFYSGAPNQSDFYQSRVNPSMKMSNIKPWDEEKVGPGLGLGYNTNSSGAGYNAGMECRNDWLPKTVNQLRVETNPKITYDLYGHEGPNHYNIKEGTTIKTQGKIEKNRPDTDYVLGPSRWFTSTGIEKAQTARGIEILQDTNRQNSNCEYFGVSKNDTQATYVSGEYRESNKHELKNEDFMAPSAVGKNNPSINDHGNNSYMNYSNNRTTTKQPENNGYINGIIKAAIAPIFDILRPTRKENTINNIRQNGNFQSNVSNMPVFNPADRTKTTIREQTENKLDNNHLNVQNQVSDGYLVNKQRAVSQNRDHTNVSYNGNPGPSSIKNVKTYDYVYNQRNNVNKTHLNRPNHGNANVHNNSQSISISKNERLCLNNRIQTPHSIIPNAPYVQNNRNNMGTTNHRNEYKNINEDRINPELLNSFKENPYTHNLSSW